LRLTSEVDDHTDIAHCQEEKSTKTTCLNLTLQGSFLKKIVLVPNSD